LALADEPAGPPPPPIELPEAEDEAENEAKEDPEPATLPPPVATPVPTATPAPVPPPSPAHPSPAPQNPAPRAAAIPVSGPSDGGNWSQIIFGADSHRDPAVASLSGSLLGDVYQGLDAAIGMMGQLLTFRAADAEKKPRLLKDLGEALYLWRPHRNEVLRDALVAWAHAQMDQQGVANRIEIVQVGDRYDMQRHNARERGVEVSAVNGWVVLRENGKVYSKASVSVK
jgi:hypothetical protein